MFVDDDCSIVSFGEGFVMVGSVNMRLIAVLFGSKTEVDDELLSSSDSEIGMYESYLLHSRY